MSTSKPARDAGLNALRSLAILVVVIYHAVLDWPPGASPIYHEFLVSIRYVALEIFTAVSGFLYAAKPIARDGISNALRDKARRLLIPLVTMTTALLALRAIMPGVNNIPGPEDIAVAFLFRFEHLWYLQSLFLIFVVISFVDGYNLLSTPARWAWAMVIWFAVSLILPLNFFFGYAGLVQLMPFFLAGYGLRRWPEILDRPGLLPAAWVLLVSGFILLHLDDKAVISLPGVVVEKWGFLNFLAGVSLVMLGIRHRASLPNLGSLGESTFAIYLFHTVGMAVANRVAAVTPWEEGYDGLVVLKIILGIVFPLALEVGIRRSGILCTLFLGDPWPASDKSDKTVAESAPQPASQGESA